MITATPQFPTILAFQHGLDRYADMWLERDWICPAFNFAAAIGQISMALGKSATTDCLGIQYPNFYQSIIGNSHVAAKSPTLARCLEGIELLREQIDPPERIRPISAINSAEGFREAFNTHTNGDANTPEPWYLDGQGVRAFCHFDELGVLFAKGKQQATSNIPVELTQMYNPSSRVVENSTRQNKSYGIDWVVNIFGCSTMAWFEKYLTEGDFTSGFLNRFVFYLHEPEPFRFEFRKIHQRTFEDWFQVLEDTYRRHALAEMPISYPLDRRATLTDAPEKFQVIFQSQYSDAWKHYQGKTAFQLFEEYAEERYSLMQADPDDIELVAQARVVTQAAKLALVYAAVTGSTSVRPEHAISAIAVSRYWAACSALILKNSDFDRRSKSERIILEKFEEKAEDGLLSRRRLRQSINGKTMSSEEFNKSFEALVNADQLGFIQMGRKGVAFCPQTWRENPVKGELVKLTEPESVESSYQNMVEKRNA